MSFAFWLQASRSGGRAWPRARARSRASSPHVPDSFRPVGRRLEDSGVYVVEGNLERWQALSDALGFANRPHIKTHKLVPLARYQIALGAKGITVQKLGEAEVMADADIDDILLTFNVVGAPKLKRLAELARRTGISVVADHAEVVAGLGEAGQAAGRMIRCSSNATPGQGATGSRRRKPRWSSPR